jgi:hypothetical protein
MSTNCPKCDGHMEHGFTTALGLMGGDRVELHQAQILFVVAGTPTSSNLITAFKQGRAGEPDDRRYRIEGSRCASCGFIELYTSGNPV